MSDHRFTLACAGSPGFRANTWTCSGKARTLPTPPPLTRRPLSAPSGRPPSWRPLPGARPSGRPCWQRRRTRRRSIVSPSGKRCVANSDGSSRRQQIVEVSIRTIASVGSRIVGSSTLSQPRSPGPSSPVPAFGRCAMGSVSTLEAKPGSQPTHRGLSSTQMRTCTRFDYPPTRTTCP